MKKNKHLNCRMNAISWKPQFTFIVSAKSYIFMCVRTNVYSICGVWCMCRFRIGLGWIGWLFGIFSVRPPIRILCCLRRQALTHTHTHMEMEKCCVEFCANKNNMLQPLHISEWLRLNRIQYANQNETFLSIDEQTAICGLEPFASFARHRQCRTHTHTFMLTPAPHCAPLIFFVPHHHFYLLKHTLKEIKSSFS